MRMLLAIVVLIVTLVFEGWVYEYPVPMLIRNGKVVDSETGAEVKPCRKADCPNCRAAQPAPRPNAEILK